MRTFILRIASFSVSALVVVATIVVVAFLRSQGTEGGGLILGALAAFMFFSVFAAGFLAILQLAENSTKLIELLKTNQKVV